MIAITEAAAGHQELIGTCSRQRNESLARSKSLGSYIAMTEDEFDAFVRSQRSYGTKDARNAEAKILHGMTLLSTLGTALWGTTDDDLRQQLLKPHPEIPAGFDLSEFEDLLHVCIQNASAVSAIHKTAGLEHLLPWSRTIVVGSESFTVLEARCEVVRRAIEYLRNR